MSPGYTFVDGAVFRHWEIRGIQNSWNSEIRGITDFEKYDSHDDQVSYLTSHNPHQIHRWKALTAR